MTTSTWKFALPVVALALLIELFHSVSENRNLYKGSDTLCTIAIGIGSFISGFFCKIAVLELYDFVHQYRLCSFDNNWLLWLLALLAADFSFYWFHRTAHEVNWFWLSHAVHHSSTHFNISIALRQPWTQQLTGQSLFWVWMPLLGFNPILVLFMYQLVLFYQFWLHTETIRKLPTIFEFIFNTPSHHRVHHGSNLNYLDRNHGGILIIWDRMFGTFKLEDEDPKYGLLGKTSSNNPISIVFSGWYELLNKAITSGSVVLAFKYFVQSPGWSHDGSSKTVKEMLQEKQSDIEYSLTSVEYSHH